MAVGTIRDVKLAAPNLTGPKRVAAAEAHPRPCKLEFRFGERSTATGRLLEEKLESKCDSDVAIGIKE